MAENSAIEWCDHTFNPWIGCQKVGPGCDNCYAEALSTARLGVQWEPGADRRRTARSTWTQPRRWNRRAAAEGRRYRVFCASLADVFDNAVPAEWRADLFALIRETPHLDWLFVTKRIGNAAAMAAAAGGWPANVWLGATVVNQAELDRDVPKLLVTAGPRIRFLSMEPLLGPVRIREHWLIHHHFGDAAIDWIIVGGESGPGARPMHPDWARSLRDQCAVAGVPFLFKQWGEWAPIGQSYTYGGSGDGGALKSAEHHGSRVFLAFADEAEERDIYVTERLQRVGKKAAGRLLDGVTYDGFPS